MARKTATPKTITITPRLLKTGDFLVVGGEPTAVVKIGKDRTGYDITLINGTSLRRGVATKLTVIPGTAPVDAEVVQDEPEAPAAEVVQVEDEQAQDEPEAPAAEVVQDEDEAAEVEAEATEPAVEEAPKVIVAMHPNTGTVHAARVDQVNGGLVQACDLRDGQQRLMWVSADTVVTCKRCLAAHPGAPLRTAAPKAKPAAEPKPKPAPAAKPTRPGPAATAADLTSAEKKALGALVIRLAGELIQQWDTDVLGGRAVEGLAGVEASAAAEQVGRWLSYLPAAEWHAALVRPGK